MIEKIESKDENFSLYKFKLKNSFMINYTYLIVNEKEKKALIIDPSWEENKVISFLKINNFVLEKILITHSHFDHVKMVDKLIKIFPYVQVFVHNYEVEHEGFYCNNLNTFSSNSIIEFTNKKVHTFHTPGHTEGSTTYLFENFLFTGDFLFIEGCGLCSTIDDAKKLYKSVQLMKEKISPDVLVFPGHCYEREPGLPFSFLLTYNVYFHLDEERFINFRLRKNQKNLFSFK